MKKFLITTFALLYGALILSASAERYNAWIDRVADTIDHPSSGETPQGFGNVQKSDPQLSQKKFIETGYVVEPPQKAAIDPTRSERHCLPAGFECRPTPASRACSSRAPPSCV